MKLGLLLLTTFLSVQISPAEEPPAIVCQRTLPAKDEDSRKLIQDSACGPCSIVNLLANGTPEMQKLLKQLPGKDNPAKTLQIINEYGAKDSCVIEGRSRFRINDDSKGMKPADLRLILNEMIEAAKLDIPKFQSTFLHRGETESSREFLLRGHTALQSRLNQGVPVIAQISSFKTNFNEGKGRFLYNRINGHYIVIVAVQNRIRSRENGFTFEYLDSWTGEMEYGYIHLDQHRAINIVKYTGATYTSDDWVGTQINPALQITSPTLDLGSSSRNWYERTYVIINRIIATAQ